jgi:hypothetical protein
MVDLLGHEAGNGGAQGKILTKSAPILQSADIVLPTTDGREIRLRRITEPTAEQNPCSVSSALRSPNVSRPSQICRADFSLA